MNEQVYKTVEAKLVFQIVLTSWVNYLEYGRHMQSLKHICRNSYERKCEVWVSLMCCRSEKGDLQRRTDCTWTMTGNEIEDDAVVGKMPM